MTRRPLLLPILFLVAGAAASPLGCSGGDASGDWRNATTAEVVRRDFASTVLATGAVRPQVGAEVRVGARISGKVVRLLANIGDAVAKGQIVAELEKEDLSATVREGEAQAAEARHRQEAEKREGPLRVRHAEALVEQARAEEAVARARLHAVEREREVEVEGAQAEVARWAATLELAEKELKRQKSLFEREVVTRDDLDRAEERFSTVDAQLSVARKQLALTEVRRAEDAAQERTALAKASVALRVAECARELEKATHADRLELLTATLAKTEAVLDNARVRLSYATIRAPISGVVGSVSTQEGETVAAGLLAPTFVTITDLRRLQVDAFVDEVDIGKVRVGQKAVFLVDAFPDREFEGEVVAIYPKAVIQENVVNYDVVVDITTAYEGLLRPEMTANVTIFLEARKGVLAVPVRAVRRERGRNILYVLADGRPEPRPVKLGWREGPWVQVVHGVGEGQTVLLESPGGKTEP
jgi:RND family efflux transporter MFP subunit